MFTGNKMKILIVGLRKQQNTFLRHKFKGFIIDALDDSMKHHRAVKNAHEYDRIISVSKFTNHTTHVNYSKHPGYMITSGGYSSVVAMLAQVLLKG